MFAGGFQGAEPVQGALCPLGEEFVISVLFLTDFTLQKQRKA